MFVDDLFTRNNIWNSYKRYALLTWNNFVFGLPLF